MRKQFSRGTNFHLPLLIVVPISPNLAILDQFLPIIRELKSLGVPMKAVSVVSADKIPNLPYDADLIRLAQDILDEFWLFRGGQVWLRSSSIRWLKLVSASLTIGRGRKLGVAPKLAHFLATLFSSPIGKILSHSQTSRSLRLSTSHQLKTILMADPGVLSLPEYSDFIASLKFELCYLMPHGNYLSPAGPKMDPISADFPVRFFASSRPRLHGAMRQHGLGRHQVSLVADPRLSLGWLDHLEHVFGAKRESKPYVYMTSRPAFNHQLSSSEKKEIIECVAQFCGLKGLDLRIRLHPKESRSRARDLIWSLRGTHGARVFFEHRPASLVAKKAKMIVNLSTSMEEFGAALEVPSLSFRKPESRRHWITGLKDLQGVPISVAEAAGITKSVQSWSDFFSVAECVLEHSAAIVKQQRSSLAKMALLESNGATRAATEIIAELKNIGWEASEKGKP